MVAETILCFPVYFSYVFTGRTDLTCGCVIVERYAWGIGKIVLTSQFLVDNPISL